MTDPNDKGYQLAACLKAIDDVEKERAEKKEELLSGFRERLSALRIEARKLQNDILAGQDNLPLEPIPEQATLKEIVGITAEAINNGLLDKDGVTVRAEIR